MPQDIQLTATDSGQNTTNLPDTTASTGVTGELDAAIAAAVEFNGKIDSALAEARSLFSSVIIEGSSQRARIHGERSAAVSAIETARNRAITAIHSANGDLTPGTADAPPIRRPPAYLTEC